MRVVVSLIATAMLFGCVEKYSETQAREHVREELKSQFNNYFDSPPGGAILVRPATGKKCIDRYDQCVEFYVRPLNETDALFHLQSDKVTFDIRPATPNEPHLVGVQFFYNWTCCGSSEIAHGTAAFSPGNEVILEGKTLNGQDLSFSY